MLILPRTYRFVSGVLLAMFAAAWRICRTGSRARRLHPSGKLRNRLCLLAQTIPFPDGQSYVYSAEWHLITAGMGVVRMDPAGNERKVTATAESQGAVNVIFPVHDRFEAHFDPRTFCSVSISKHSEEGAHKRETSIHFDYARKKSVLDEKNLKTGETKRVENDLAGMFDRCDHGILLSAIAATPAGSNVRVPDQRRENRDGQGGR